MAISIFPNAILTKKSSFFSLKVHLQKGLELLFAIILFKGKFNRIKIRSINKIYNYE